jgi:hypothetical protein
MQDNLNPLIKKVSLLGASQSNSSWSLSAIGRYVYACTTPGGLTQVLSSGSGEQVQIVGMALSATQIDLDPQLVLVEVQ